MDKSSIEKYDKGTVRADIEYNAVFCTCRSRKVFRDEGISCFFTELVKIILKEMECELLLLKVFEDHVVLSIKATASLSPISIFYSLRYNTSQVMRQKYDFLKKSRALWGRGLLLSTKEIDEVVYLNFLKEQKRKV